MKMSNLKITRCEGEGQGSCKRCEDHGIWNRQWMKFLYEIDGYDGCYCEKCVREICREMSSDLISRKALAEEISSLHVFVNGLRSEKGVLAKFSEEYKRSVLKCIEEAPVAYDINSVVNQIADYRDLVPGWALKEIIDIVRSGGKKS